MAGLTVPVIVAGMANTGPSPNGSSRHRVLIAGGGVAALEAMLALRELAGPLVDVELIAPEPHFWYRPLAVAEPFGLGTVHQLELAELCEQAGADFSLGTLVGVDHARRRVQTHHGELAYDSLLVAVGAVGTEAIPGAFTFRGPADSRAYRHLLTELEQGTVRRLVFALPGGQNWPLPLYELALLTASFVEGRQIPGVSLEVVTPEHPPLALFGPDAAAALVAQLEAHGVALTTETYPVAFVDGKLELTPSGELAADRVVTLPRLTGPGIEGLPQDPAGFIPTDEHGRVQGVDVFAAGDATSFPVKQGGLAAQQAVAAAQSIAAEAGADLTPEPFRAVLRGLLLTGGLPKFMRSNLADWGSDAFLLDSDPLWWPPAKLACRYLSPFLAQHADYKALSGPPPTGIPVEIDLGARIGESS
jgi:sulfide:quinone oxidoreductase